MVLLSLWDLSREAYRLNVSRLVPDECGDLGDRQCQRQHFIEPQRDGVLAQGDGKWPGDTATTFQAVWLQIIRTQVKKFGQTSHISTNRGTSAATYTCLGQASNLRMIVM